MSLGLAKYLMSFGVLTHNTKRQSTKKSKGFPGLNKIKDFYSVKDKSKNKSKTSTRTFSSQNQTPDESS